MVCPTNHTCPLMTLEEFIAEWNNGSDTIAVHTSGSTGTPKAMQVEKQRMRASAQMTCDFLRLSPGMTALLCMDLKYIGAKMMVVRALTRHLQLVAVPPCGHPLAHLPKEYPQGGGIQFAAMVPLQVYNSLQSPEEAALLQSIDHLIIGGGAIDPALERRLKAFPHHVWSTYGMTETLSHIALRRINGPTASPYYQPFPGVRLTTDSSQCLIIDAPALHTGALHTHDRVELLPDQRFRILGRIDCVIVSGGVKIQMEEVETALAPLLSKPFLITKARDEKFGERVVLLTEDTDLATLQETCAAALPRYWVPRQYTHVDKIPLTPNGKLARAEAERLATEGTMANQDHA